MFRSPPPDPHRRAGAASFVFLFALGLTLSSAPARSAETIFLTNTAIKNAEGNLITELHLLEIDDAAGTAQASLIDIIPLETVDALACTPNDLGCYFIDKYHPTRHPNGGRWGRYDFVTREFEVLGEIRDAAGELIEGVVLAGHSPGPNGVLIFGSQSTDSLYVLDKTSGRTFDLGPVRVDGTEADIDLNGADLVFTADGLAFLWTNNENLPDAPMGLYFIAPTNEGGRPRIYATYIGTGDDGQDPESHFFTGLAIRDNGLGLLVGSNRFDELHQQNLDGSDAGIFTMLRGEQPLGHFAGDMHHSFDCFLDVRLDRQVVAPGETLRLDLELVHNLPETVRAPFVLWIESPTGEVVLETRSRERVFEWGDRVAGSFPVVLPDGLVPGEYTLHVGLDRMRQGLATVKRTFAVR